MYVLDSNVFIQAKNTYYAFGICPGFWESLIWHYGDGSVCSTDKVRAELVRGRTTEEDYERDDLARWVRDSIPREAFCTTDAEDVLHWYREVIRWAFAQDHLEARAKAEFAEEHRADAWLIAFSRARGHTLVTHEKLDERCRKRILIPNVCRQFDVPYVDSFQMLDQLRTQFAWNQP